MATGRGKWTASALAAARQWPVLALVAGDGSQGDSGRVLAAGKIYLSCQAKANADKFWIPDALPINLVSVSGAGPHAFETYPLRGLPLPVYLLDRGLGPGRFVVPANHALASEYATVGVLWFARRHPGTVVMIDSIGAGAKHRGLAAYHVRGVRRPIRDGGCLRAAMLNAVAAVCGSDDAVIAQQSLGAVSRSVQSVRRVGHILRQLPFACGVEAKSEELADALHRGRSKVARLNPFEFFAGESDGVYVVHLKKDGVVDHDICVDCARRLIWDNDEEFAIKLSLETLWMCGGEGTSRLRIEDARKVVARKT